MSDLGAFSSSPRAWWGTDLENLAVPDEEARRRVRRREAMLTKPEGSLGRLEALTEWFVGWTRVVELRAPHVVIFAGNHAAAESQKTSAWPMAVTGAMVDNFERGGAAINALCGVAQVELVVECFALDVPAADFTCGPALTEAQARRAWRRGAEVVARLVEKGSNCLALGEMGIGNSAAAAAVALGLWGGRAEDWVGLGAGMPEEGMARKVAAVRQAIEVNGGGLAPLELLRRVGGFEFCALAGACVAARRASVAVIIDGFVCTAALAPLAVACEGALAHSVIGHLSSEPGHQKMVEQLGMRPLLDLSMRLGEGSGAVLGLQLVRSALACHRDMARFEEAGIG